MKFLFFVVVGVLLFVVDKIDKLDLRNLFANFSNNTELEKLWDILLVVVVDVMVSSFKDMKPC
jgi:hypothetical protein